jgi:hypothetical protein
MENSYILLFFVNLIHIIDDVAENTTSWGIEGVLKWSKDPVDKDDIYNFSGDIFSGFIGSFVAMKIFG